MLTESDSPIKHVTSLGQLGGKKVCAVTGSLSLAHIAAATPHPIPVAAPYWTNCMVLLQQGDVAAVSTVSTVLLGLADQDPYARIVSPVPCQNSCMVADLAFRGPLGCSAVLADQATENLPALDPGGDVDGVAGLV